MDKRYQVFISSTFADLKEERSKVIQTIMELDCIPAGMEIFPAIDDEQFNFIKRVIDDCDYYILIIGGRYGTISEDGISYTEKEYNYAIEKGIKVLAFIHSDPNTIAIEKSEIEVSARIRLEEFRKKVATGRLIKHWKHADELPGLVALSLPKTIKTYPAVGWIRANAGNDLQLLKELNELRKENQDLKSRLQNESKKEEDKFGINNLAGLQDSITIQGYVIDDYRTKVEWSQTVTWLDIFRMISKRLPEKPYDTTVRLLLSKEVYQLNGVLSGKAEILDENFILIKYQLQALGLVEIPYTSTYGYRWNLTPKGVKLSYEIWTQKKIV